MVRLEGAYTDRDGITFEFSTLAFTAPSAKVKVGMALFGRRPGQITALSDIEVKNFGSGMLSEYRVTIRLDDPSNNNIKSILRLPEARRIVEELL